MSFPASALEPSAYRCTTPYTVAFGGHTPAAMAAPLLLMLYGINLYPMVGAKAIKAPLLALAVARRCNAVECWFDASPIEALGNRWLTPVSHIIILPCTIFKMFFDLYDCAHICHQLRHLARIRFWASALTYGAKY